MTVVSVASSTDITPVVLCRSCTRYRSEKIVVDGLCSYCRRALGLMPDQLAP